MRKLILILSICLFLVGTGCVFDDLAGVRQDASGTFVSDGGVIGTAAEGASLFWPGIGGAFSGLLNLYLMFRNRNWKRAAQTGVNVVAKVREKYGDDGKIDVKDLLAICEILQAKESTYKEIDKLRQ